MQSGDSRLSLHKRTSFRGAKDDYTSYLAPTGSSCGTSVGLMRSLKARRSAIRSITWRSQGAGLDDVGADRSPRTRAVPRTRPRFGPRPEGVLAHGHAANAVIAHYHLDTRDSPIALNTASTGPSPMLASRRMLPS